MFFSVVFQCFSDCVVVTKQFILRHIYVNQKQSIIMKSTITTPNSEPFSFGNYSIHNSHSGLLNSKYKSVVDCSFKSLKKPSIFNIRRRLKSSRLRNCCSIETALKVSVFIIGLIVALN